MTTVLFRSLLTIVLVGAASAANADVCLTIDESRDTFAARDRATALLLVSTRFESEGERVVPGGCPNPLVIVHSQLDSLIVVTMTRQGMTWQATAQTTSELPAVYSQMVRAIVTGRPMTGLSVVDRTNVTSSQSDVRRVHSDSLWYGRIGYGGIFSEEAYGVPAIGFGFRAELDSFAIDVSFLNHQLPSGSSSSPRAFTSSWLKLSGLRFLNPEDNNSVYFGGGLSYGHGSISRGRSAYNAAQYATDWTGHGLQGELTAGYEIGRVTTLRLFVQVDAVVPFYRLTSETRSTQGVLATDSRYAPSLVVSLGVGR